MDKYKQLLKQFISFKSISTNSDFKNEIDGVVEWLVKLFEDNNFKSEIIDGYTNPIIISSFVVDKTKPTLMIYGHYDVQPADILDGWNKDPFELEECDGRLYARGAIDNKGQVLIHMINIFRLIEEKMLNYNVKFIFEGCEEIGSPEIENFIIKNKELLKSDFILISDGYLENNQPTIEAGLRGLLGFELILNTSSKELHSGLYGGTVPNAAHELSALISKTISGNKVLIDGFYNDVDDIPSDLLKRDIVSNDELMHLTGTKSVLYDTAIYDFLSQSGLQPALEITSLKSGYLGEGFKNSIPNTASAKFNFRTVQSQDHIDLTKIIKRHLNLNIPEYIEWEIKDLHSEEGIKLDVSSNKMKEIRSLLEKVFDKEVIEHYSGGSIPLVTYLDKHLDSELLLIPLANVDSNMHGANENFDIEILEKCMEFSYELLKDFNS